MDDSVMKRLPKEIRLQVYGEVFDDTRIKVIVKRTFSKRKPDSVVSGYKIKIKNDSAILATCRAARDEAMVVMWAKAVVQAVDGGSEYPIDLQDLNDALPHAITKQIIHLRGIIVPILSWKPTIWYPDTPTFTAVELLARYPKLQTCEIYSESIDHDLDAARLYPTAKPDGTPIGNILRDKTDLTRHFLPFATKSGEERLVPQFARLNMMAIAL